MFFLFLIVLFFSPLFFHFFLYFYYETIASVNTFSIMFEVGVMYAESAFFFLYHLLLSFAMAFLPVVIEDSFQFSLINRRRKESQPLYLSLI